MAVLSVRPDRVPVPAPYVEHTLLHPLGIRDPPGWGHVRQVDCEGVMSLGRPTTAAESDLGAHRGTTAEWIGG